MTPIRKNQHRCELGLIKRSYHTKTSTSLATCINFLKPYIPDSKNFHQRRSKKGMIIKKTPPLIALVIGTLVGGLFSLIFQPQIITELSKGSNSSIFSRQLWRFLISIWSRWSPNTQARLTWKVAGL